MKRGMTVLKMRGSVHDKRIREFRIDHEGMHLGAPFRNVTGIMAGAPAYVSPDELEWLWSKFDERGGGDLARVSADVGERRRGAERRQT